MVELLTDKAFAGFSLVYGFISWLIAAFVGEGWTRFLGSLLAVALTISLRYFGLRTIKNRMPLHWWMPYINDAAIDTVDKSKLYALLLPSILTQINATATTLWLSYAYEYLKGWKKVALTLLLLIPTIANLGRYDGNWTWILLQAGWGIVLGIVFGFAILWWNKEEAKEKEDKTTTQIYKYVAIGVVILAVIAIFAYLFKHTGEITIPRSI